MLPIYSLDLDQTCQTVANPLKTTESFPTPTMDFWQQPRLDISMGSSGSSDHGFPHRSHGSLSKHQHTSWWYHGSQTPTWPPGARMDPGSLPRCLNSNKKNHFPSVTQKVLDHTFEQNIRGQSLLELQLVADHPASPIQQQQAQTDSHANMNLKEFLKAGSGLFLESSCLQSTTGAILVQNILVPSLHFNVQV